MIFNLIKIILIVKLIKILKKITLINKISMIKLNRVKMIFGRGRDDGDTTSAQLFGQSGAAICVNRSHRGIVGAVLHLSVQKEE
jgi:hypothetical protein